MDCDSGPLCLLCGQATDSQRQINTLANGERCPHCRARLLEELPPLLPGLGAGMPEGYEGLGAEPYEPGSRHLPGPVEPAVGDVFDPDDPIAG